MQNFIFISPHFPHTYWEFCQRLKQNGVRVLGIADAPYDELQWQLREALTEYYRVSSLENYDEVYRAVAYFAFRYGKIDWIESNNEYWLSQDARLRTDFNVSTGIQTDRIKAIKEKSEMKLYYAKGNIPTARQIRAAKGYDAVLGFARQTGYPIIAKPDVGVGASGTHKIDTDNQLQHFFSTVTDYQNYVVEEFITGEICSYDAIVDVQGNPLELAGLTINALKDMTAMDLAYIWSGTAISENEDILAWQQMLRQSAYFSPNLHRPFLFRAQTREEVEKALAPRELNQQEIGEKVREKFSDLRFSKAGYYPEKKTVVLTFSFPDAIDRESFLDKEQKFENDTGWHIEINPSVNHAIAQGLLNREFGVRLKKNSYFEGANRDNNYIPAEPLKITIYDNPYSYPEDGWATLHMDSSGADSPRQIKCRLKPSTNQWFLVENMALSDIRIPKEADPWA